MRNRPMYYRLLDQEHRKLENRVNALEKRLEKFEEAIEYSRQYYHLPQNVYDVFRALVPNTVELVETHNELYERFTERSSIR